MAYTDPNSIMDVNTGSIPPASLFDQYRTNQEWFANNCPRARVYNSANISIATTTDTTITFDSERFDVGGCHSTSSNTSRLTVPSGGDGLYLITAHIVWESNASGYRRLRLQVNGTTTIAGQFSPTSTGLVFDQSLSTIYQLAAGDYVEMVVRQSSGGAVNVLRSNALSPEMSFTWLSN